MERGRNKYLADYGRYAALGVQYFLVGVLFGWFGHWADTKLGTHPWLLILGIVLAAVGMFISLIHKIPPPTRPSKPKTPDDPGPPRP